MNKALGWLCAAVTGIEVVVGVAEANWIVQADANGDMEYSSGCLSQARFHGTIRLHLAWMRMQRAQSLLHKVLQMNLQDCSV